MAKKQTRKSISVSRSLYQRLQSWALEHSLPASQVAEQAVEAVLAGKFEVKPQHWAQHMNYNPVRRRWTSELPAITLQAPTIAPQIPKPPTAPKLTPGTCAICTAVIANVIRREPLGRNGGLVAVCDGCASETPLQRRFK